MALKAVDGVAQLDVVDDGVGMSMETAEQRLAQGHIGLASHRTRVEAGGGMLTLLDAPSGTHLRVTVPLRM